MLDQVTRSPLVMNSGVLQRVLAAAGASFKTDGQYARGTGLFATDLGPEARAGLDSLLGHYERMRLAERGEKVESLDRTPTLYTEAELRATPQLRALVAPGHDIATDPATGEPAFLPRAEAARREQAFAATLATELAASPDDSPDRLRARETPEGETVYAGRHVPAEALTALRAREDANPRLIDSLALLSQAMRESPGAEVHFTHVAPARRAGERARLVTEHVETPVGIQFSPAGGLVLHSLSRERVERSVELLAREGLLAPWQGEAAAARTAIERYAENQALGQPVAAGLTRPQHQTLQALFGDLALYTRDRTLNALRLKQSRNQPLLQSRPLDRLSQLRLLDPNLAPARPNDGMQFRPEEGEEVGSTENQALQPAKRPVDQHQIITRLKELIDIGPILALDPAARVGFRGSLARGRKGHHKNFDKFDPTDFDLDLLIVSDKLSGQFRRDEAKFRNASRVGLKEYQQSVESMLRKHPEFKGLREESIAFKIYTQKEIQYLRNYFIDAQIYFTPRR